MSSIFNIDKAASLIIDILDIIFSLCTVKSVEKMLCRFSTDGAESARTSASTFVRLVFRGVLFDGKG